MQSVSNWNERRNKTNVTFRTQYTYISRLCAKEWKAARAPIVIIAYYTLYAFKEKETIHSEMIHRIERVFLLLLVFLRTLKTNKNIITIYADPFHFHSVVSNGKQQYVDIFYLQKY